MRESAVERKLVKGIRNAGGWALKFVGLAIPQETLSDTFLVSWFMDRSILVHFLGI